MTPQRQSASRLERRISANDAAILGLLMDGVTSGYDLNKRIHGSVGFFWTHAKSHVYGTLARLVDDGYATVRPVPQEARPDKQLYRISGRGRLAFLDWLANAPLEPARFRNPFLLKIFFGRHLDRERLIAHVEEGRAEVQEELSQLEAIEGTIDRERSFHGWLTLTYGLERDRATIRWADAVLAELRRRT
jgi:DNA-binding PadR family transcriptional regulator